jgi:hypothetical protein
MRNPDSRSIRSSGETSPAARSGLTGVETADTREIHQFVIVRETQAQKSRLIFQREQPGA